MPIGIKLATAPVHLLFVDDESNILKALQRLFYVPDTKIFTAQSGAEALEILQLNPIDLIISNMRMPQMDGAEFLSLVAENWPETVRILLTGYADLASTVAAVNKGHIYCYCSKPWEDNELRILVNNALAQKRLRDERQQLFAIIDKQNSELKDLNANLEHKVERRSEQLKLSLQKLMEAHSILKKQYIEIIKAFAAIIEMRPGIKSGHSLYIAEHARNLALRMGLDPEACRDILYAGLLLQIGKMSLTDDLLRQPLHLLSSFEKQRYMHHAKDGWSLLRGIDALKNAAELIQHQYEYYNGSGEPQALKGVEIPLGTRILTVIRDYFGFLDGHLTGSAMTIDQVKSRLLLHKNKEYDPNVVEEFLALLSEHNGAEHRPIIEIFPQQLQAGMKIAEILCNDAVFLQNTVLTNEHIATILAMHKQEKNLIIKIRV